MNMGGDKIKDMAMNMDASNFKDMGGSTIADMAKNTVSNGIIPNVGIL